MLTLTETRPELSLSVVFEEIRKTLYSAYRYLQGNCHCNAHLASLALKSKGIKHKKVWIFAPSLYSETSNESLRIYDRNQISPDGWINWGYHVAPIITVNGSDFVFDYNFSEIRPLSLSEWLNCFEPGNFKYLIEEADNFLFHTRDYSGKQLFDYRFHPLEGESLQNSWLEKGLAVNETALEMYHECYLPAVRNGGPEELLQDYKMLIGRVLNFECVFRDQAFNRRMTQAFQNRHSDLIHYYRHTYEHNVIKWKLVVDHYRST